MIKTYVLNLDRHVERLDQIADELVRQEISWERFSGFDAHKVSDELLDNLVARSGPIPRMPRGARACTAGHVEIIKEFLSTDASHLLVLEDDAVLSSSFTNLISKIVVNRDIGILNISRQIPSGREKKLIVRSLAAISSDQFQIYDLVGIHYSCAGYLMDRTSAKLFSEVYATIDVPIDHALFNPNVSKLYGKTPVRQLFPAIVKPREDLISSIQTAPVSGARSFRSRIKRAKAEVSIVPRLLIGLILGRYKVKTLDFKTD